MKHTETEPAIPRADASERYILGSLVRFPERAALVFDTQLRAFDFVDTLHQRIFSTFAEQFQRGDIDPVLVGRATDHGYLLQLGDDVVTTTHIEAEAEKIIDARRKRQLFDIASSARIAAQNGHTSDDVRRLLGADLDDFDREIQSSESFSKFSFADLHSQYRSMKPVLIDGLARRGEVINIISNPKVGKSWFSYDLALSVITGRPLFGRFPTTPSRALIVDNELHRETLAHRIPMVAEAREIESSEYQSDLDIWSLRGNLRSFYDVADELEREHPDTYGLILFDAKYRFAVAGQSENDNASEALFYNRADQLAGNTGAAVAFIHHASKGSQSDKRVSDVGSGAGAQSRAADVHCVFREHEDDGTFVFEALVRSFAPVQPIGLRWMFPLWVADEGIDTQKLKGRGTKQEERQSERDKEGINAIVDALRKWDAEADGPATPRAMRELTGLSKERQQRLLDWMVANGHATATNIKVRGNLTREYALKD